MFYFLKIETFFIKLHFIQYFGLIVLIHHLCWSFMLRSLILFIKVMLDYLVMIDFQKYWNFYHV